MMECIHFVLTPFPTICHFQVKWYNTDATLAGDPKQVDDQFGGYLSDRPPTKAK